MSEDISIWSKEYKPVSPPPAAPPPQSPPGPPTEYPPGYEEALQQYLLQQRYEAAMRQQQQKPPGKAKRIIFGILGLVINLTMRAVGLGLIALGHTLNFLKGKSGSKKMSLRSVFLGAALVTGALMAPGGYYMTQPNDVVRTRVTGKVMADATSEFPGQKYFIYTNQGKFDTYGVEGGKDIKEGCVYDFNLKSARLQLWPPGYSRSIQGYKPVDGGGCAP